MTDRQRQVYALAIRHYAAIGEPCSMAWLARRLGRHRNTIKERVQALARKGWIVADTPAFRRLHL